MVDPPCTAPPAASLTRARAAPTGSTPGSSKNRRSSIATTAACIAGAMAVIGTGMRYCSSIWAIALPLRSSTVVTAGMAAVDGSAAGVGGAGASRATRATPTAAGTSSPARTRPPATVTASRRRTVGEAGIRTHPIVPGEPVSRLKIAGET